jgi:hypothetical protein
MYLFCNSRIHVTTLYLGYVCVYYASMLQCWHLVWILVRTDHPYLGVGCHNQGLAMKNKCLDDKNKITYVKGFLQSFYCSFVIMMILPFNGI